MIEHKEENPCITYNLRKQICLYLFQQGIGYKRASKLLGLKLYTTKDYHRQFTHGRLAFARWQAYKPNDPDFLKVVRMMPQMRSASIEKICKSCGVQFEKILVYSCDYEKEQRYYKCGDFACSERAINSTDSFYREQIGMDEIKERDYGGVHPRLDGRSGNWTKSKSQAKKKRLDKVRDQVAKGVPVTKACAAAKLNTKAYYRARTRTEKQISDDMLAILIKDIQVTLHAQFTYGIDRMTAEVNQRLNTLDNETKSVILRKSKVINHKRIERIMKEYKLNAHIKRAKMPKNYYKAQKESKERNKAPNVLKRKFFDVKTPGRIYVTDVTYLPRLEGGFIYLSTLMDLANQEIVSYVISNENSAAMVEKTLLNITEKLSANCIVHSDQGAVYKSDEWLSFCKEYGIIRSMSRKGNCWDNSVMENFFSRLKSDLHITKRETRSRFLGKKLRQMVSEYIEWYNNSRIQKRLGYLSPVEYRKKIGSADLTIKEESDTISAS